MTSDATLPCGTDPDLLLAQVADHHGERGRDGPGPGGSDAHQAQCPHCQAALAEYARLWVGFEELAATEVLAPPGLIERALAMVREQAGPTGYGRVSEGPDSFLVAARAVVSVAGHAARSSAGVRMALGALPDAADVSPADVSPGVGSPGVGSASVAAGVSGQSVAVELVVAAEYGHDLQRLAAHLRERVAAEVRAQTGLEVVSVDVDITDVFPRFE